MSLSPETNPRLHVSLRAAFDLDEPALDGVQHEQAQLFFVARCGRAQRYVSRFANAGNDNSVTQGIWPAETAHFDASELLELPPEQRQVEVEVWRKLPVTGVEQRLGACVLPVGRVVGQAGGGGQCGTHTLVDLGTGLPAGRVDVAVAYQPSSLSGG